MPLTSGSRLGPYEIVAPIGAGGMGEVYRARDTRLGRVVALKVLPQHLSGDPARRERFEREARAVSALNHPHICTLHDIGSEQTPEGPVDYIVMEHIEGETLADRILKGPLPIDQVLRYAGEIADALDRAHRQGVIHRDLKPGNIMLTRSGGAKLLDFGLAKLSEGRTGAPDTPILPGSGGGSVLPTATRNLTTAGTLLGTFQYMAPEQLEGKEADARTDIFTFGLVVYEMATGRRAFEGRSQASLIAAILKEQPRPISEVQPLVPAGLDRVVRACLEKDPDDRVQTAHDLRRQLGWVADGSLSAAGTSAPVSSPSVAAQATGAAPRRRPGLTWLAAPALLLFGAAMVGLGWWLRPAPVRPVLRVNLVLPPKTQLDTENRCLALSPDGSVLAYAGSGADGKRLLWVRRLDSLQAQALAGTDDATYPFWSPDGAFLGFFAEGKLKKVPAGGGTVQALCDAADGRGASWGAAGTIVFSPGPYGGLSMVASSGGSVTPLTTTTIDGTTHRLPCFLPDGRRLLFLASVPGKDAENGIYSIDLGGKVMNRVAAEASEGRFVPPGYLVFVRDGNLMAQRMDPETLRLSGEAVPVAEKVQFNPNRWNGGFAFSDNGLLVYQGGAGIPKSRLTWFDQDGKELGAVGDPANFVGLALAPDLRRAVATIAPGNGMADLWMYDLTRGVGSRFTFSSKAAYSPAWSPDARQIAYADDRNRIFVKAVDGASEPRQILDAGNNREVTQWTPDGAGLLFWTQDPKNGLDIQYVPVAAGGAPRAVLATPASERDGAISPDGRWLMYNSNESGRREQYVVSYPAMGGKWQVSTSGAVSGLWVDAGRRVVYADLDGRIMSVDITSQAGNLTIGSPRPTFGDRPVNGPVSLAPDGRRILVAVPTEESLQSSLVVVTDWASTLPKP